MCLNAAQNNTAEHPECKSTETIFRESVTDPIAYYSFWLTVFTLVLAIVGVAQWDLISRQIKLTEEQFIVEHRPRLRVRNFYIDPNRAAENDGAFTGQFTVVNLGDSDAAIISSHIIIYWYNGELPMKRPFDVDNPNNQFPLIKLKAGDPYPAIFGPQQIKRDSERSTGEHISIMGFIDYKSAVGTRRRTAFCRTYHLASKRFTKSENEDYEHEE